ncbi:MAG: NAD(P)/FAD-dependent oxidoreductase [Alphaproteobacteria bacterium]
MSTYDYDVAIIGSGPSGIGAATALSNAGIKNIIVLEREAQVGGIPRHTHHPSFGLLVFKHPVTGPKFICALLKRCPDVQFKTNTTVVALRPDGVLDLATPDGIETVRARHIVLATGARETPRHGRLISGLRPQGIMTTGALQQFVYAAKIKPVKSPVIIGTELVSFSALWTLRSSGAKSVAMIEENPRITAFRPAALFARLMGVPIYYNTKIIGIGGINETRHVEIENIKGERQTLACDGIIFSGNFVGDNNLARASHLTLHPSTQIPLVDQSWTSSDPAISVIGNSAHPADMGDQCYQEGLIAGRSVAAILEGGKASFRRIELTHDDGIKMTTPNVVHPSGTSVTRFNICLHVIAPYTGVIEVTYGDEVLYRKSRRCMPARRITLKNIRFDSQTNGMDRSLHVSLKDQS